MGYARLFEILAYVTKPVKIKALATCSGLDETKVIFILMRNQIDLGVTFEEDGYIRTEAMVNE